MYEHQLSELMLVGMANAATQLNEKSSLSIAACHTLARVIEYMQDFIYS